MRYIKSITQQKLSFLLAIYIGLFMNGAVFYRRFGSYAHDFTVWKGVSAVVELAATVLVTFFLLRLLSGRFRNRISVSLAAVNITGKTVNRHCHGVFQVISTGGKPVQVWKDNRIGIIFMKEAGRVHG